VEQEMGNSSRNLWNRNDLKEITKTSVTARVTTKPSEEEVEEKKILEQEEKTEIVQNNKEKVEMVDIPDLPLDELEEAAEVEEEDVSVQDESGGSVVFGMIGTGQAGGRLIESFYNLGYKKVLAINTANNDLDGLSSVPEFQKILMSGDNPGGAGKDMRLGEQAADKYQQEIYERMQKVFGSVDRIFVCVGGGGGTGGGSCLRLVETAKKYLTYLGVPNVNSKVGVLLTLPSAGEAASPTIADNAHLISSKLCSLAKSGDISPLVIFDNDKIKRMFPKLTVKKFWPTVNATVTGLFHMFNVLSNKVGNPTSFDPADYQRVLSSGGCMIMGFTTLKEYADGTDVSKAIRGNLEKGLLCGGFDVSSARAAACIATASDEILSDTPGLMDSLETGFDTLANITGSATVFRGIYEVEKNKLVVYTMITGLSEPTKRLNDLKKFQNKTSTKKQKLYE
jgi:cell division GTPase FtsZ